MAYKVLLNLALAVCLVSSCTICYLLFSSFHKPSFSFSDMSSFLQPQIPCKSSNIYSAETLGSQPCPIIILANGNSSFSSQRKCCFLKDTFLRPSIDSTGWFSLIFAFVLACNFYPQHLSLIIISNVPCT